MVSKGWQKYYKLICVFTNEIRRSKYDSYRNTYITFENSSKMRLKDKYEDYNIRWGIIGRNLITSKKILATNARLSALLSFMHLRKEKRKIE